jgi:hypothetical protein
MTVRCTTSELHRLLNPPSPCIIVRFPIGPEQKYSACLSRNTLKVHLHEIFDFCFFSSKTPTWSPDSYPKFVSNLKSNSPRYSNYSSLCVDSVNAELNSCFMLQYIKNVNIFWLMLAPFEHFIVNFSKSYPLQAPELFSLIHLPHTE